MSHRMRFVIDIGVSFSTQTSTLVFTRRVLSTFVGSSLVDGITEIDGIDISDQFMVNLENQPVVKAVPTPKI